MEKKSYYKPFLIKEQFTTAHYCSICNTKLTDLHTLNGNASAYIDWIKDGKYDKDKEYMYSSGMVTGAKDGVYKDVKTYYLEKSYSASGDDWFEVTRLQVSCDFSTSAFTLHGNTSPRYRFVFIKSVDIKILNQKAYYNVS